ncbi:MAG: amidophosphoribosyltransferase [Candidatus Atribacteria bacterium]|nr:amidophosphoribosyltransferase [Candidatus Atribacteria bacterium]
MKEECGVFGIFNRNKELNVAKLTFYGIFSLQHRGQESAGIAVTSGENILVYRDLGLVSEVFNERILNTLKGNIAIGHVRYSTAGMNSWENSQPILNQFSGGSFALAHNGHIINQDELRERLSSNRAEDKNKRDADSHLICQLIHRSGEEDIEKALEKAVSQLKGAFCLVILTEDRLIGIRDPLGFHPLVLGKVEGGYVISSEDCAFSLINAEYVREIQPGEMVVVDRNGLRSKQILSSKRKAQCIFEYIYFARPDSTVFGENVAVVRERIGQKLAQEHPVEADIVISVPDSGRFAALGYSQASGIPYQEGLVKNPYVTRTFIQPDQIMREHAVKLKLSPISEIVKDKRIIMVDDSIVRGTTSRKLVKLLKNSGAREVHVRISSPPVNFPCHYGIDTPTKEELWATQFSVEQIRQWIEADTLGYVSLDGLLQVFQKNKASDFCTACFSGQYPI